MSPLLSRLMSLSVPPAVVVGVMTDVTVVLEANTSIKLHFVVIELMHFLSG